MTFTKKQNDDLCVAAGIAPLGFGPHVYYFIDGRDPVSRCAVCNQRYNHEPTSGPPDGWEAWWGICKLAKGAPGYPDLLTAEGFLILLEAMRVSGWYVKEISDQSFGEPEETNETSWLCVFEKPNSRNSWEYGESLSIQQPGWGDNLREAAFRAAANALEVHNV